MDSSSSSSKITSPEDDGSGSKSSDFDPEKQGLFVMSDVSTPEDEKTERKERKKAKREKEKAKAKRKEEKERIRLKEERDVLKVREALIADRQLEQETMIKLKEERDVASTGAKPKVHPKEKEKESSSKSIAIPRVKQPSQSLLAIEPKIEPVVASMAELQILEIKEMEPPRQNFYFCSDIGKNFKIANDCYNIPLKTMEGKGSYFLRIPIKSVLKSGRMLLSSAKLVFSEKEFEVVEVEPEGGATAEVEVGEVEMEASGTQPTVGEPEKMEGEGEEAKEETGGEPEGGAVEQPTGSEEKFVSPLLIEALSRNQDDAVGPNRKFISGRLKHLTTQFINNEFLYQRFIEASTTHIRIRHYINQLFIDNFQFILNMIDWSGVKIEHLGRLLHDNVWKAILMDLAFLREDLPELLDLQPRRSFANEYDRGVYDIITYVNNIACHYLALEGQLIKLYLNLKLCAFLHGGPGTDTKEVKDIYYYLRNRLLDDADSYAQPDILQKVYLVFDELHNRIQPKRVYEIFELFTTYSTRMLLRDFIPEHRWVL